MQRLLVLFGDGLGGTWDAVFSTALRMTRGTRDEGRGRGTGATSSGASRHLPLQGKALRGTNDGDGRRGAGAQVRAPTGHCTLRHQAKNEAIPVFRYSLAAFGSNIVLKQASGQSSSLSSPSQSISSSSFGFSWTWTWRRVTRRFWICLMVMVRCSKSKLWPLAG